MATEKELRQKAKAPQNAEADPSLTIVRGYYLRENIFFASSETF